jgi:hypothetical protein
MNLQPTPDFFLYSCIPSFFHNPMSSAAGLSVSVASPAQIFERAVPQRIHLDQLQQLTKELESSPLVQK